MGSEYDVGGKKVRISGVPDPYLDINGEYNQVNEDPIIYKQERENFFLVLVDGELPDKYWVIQNTPDSIEGETIVYIFIKVEDNDNPEDSWKNNWSVIPEGGDASSAVSTNILIEPIGDDSSLSVKSGYSIRSEPTDPETGEIRVITKLYPSRQLSGRGFFLHSETGDYVGDVGYEVDDRKSGITDIDKADYMLGELFNYVKDAGSNAFDAEKVKPISDHFITNKTDTVLNLPRYPRRPGEDADDAESPGSIRSSPGSGKFTGIVPDAKAGGGRRIGGGKSKSNKRRKNIKSNKKRKSANNKKKQTRKKSI
jgi:hypothetical protein